MALSISLFKDDPEDLAREMSEETRFTVGSAEVNARNERQFKKVNIT